jgi:hypothetical protein
MFPIFLHFVMVTMLLEVIGYEKLLDTKNLDQHSSSNHNREVLLMMTGCRSVVAVLLLSIREAGSSSPARAGRVKPKTFNIVSDCSFAKSTALRSENQRSFGYDLKNGAPMSQ